MEGIASAFDTIVSGLPWVLPLAFVLALALVGRFFVYPIISMAWDAVHPQRRRQAEALLAARYGTPVQHPIHVPMTTYEIVSTNLFLWPTARCDILDGPIRVAHADVFPWPSREGVLDVAGLQHRVFTVGPEFAIERDGVILARGKWVSKWFKRATFLFTHEGGSYMLRHRGGEEYEVEHDGEVGTMKGSWFLRLGASAQLPEQWPLLPRLFAIWMGIYLWKKSAGSADGGG